MWYTSTMLSAKDYLRTSTSIVSAQWNKSENGGFRQTRFSKLAKRQFTNPHSGVLVKNF